MRSSLQAKFVELDVMDADVGKQGTRGAASIVAAQVLGGSPAQHDGGLATIRLQKCRHWNAERIRQP
ncbi:MAG: hypothetical protein IPO66_16790 [Rhodanobacteraceae bacterium]|nr:hypothetical protein [Rhodanobacteraceae bacterium]